MAKNKNTRERATLTNSPVAPGPTTTSEEEILATADDRSERQSPSYDEIAQAAYRRYESRGRTEGQEFDDWIEAERELRQRTRPSSE